MAEAPSPHAFPEHDDDEMLALSRDLERMVEDVENMSVQLTWMAYDLVALRTAPALAASVLELEEAARRCRAAVRATRGPEPEDGQCRDRAAAALAQT